MRFPMIMMALTLLVTAQAQAFNYPNGTIKLNKPVSLPDANGNMLALTSGPASVVVEGKPMWGKEPLKIRTAQGEVVVEIPKANYMSGWSFMLPAQGKVAYTLKGVAHDDVKMGTPVKRMEECSIRSQILDVRSTYGQPYTVKDFQDREVPLQIYVCAERVNGETRVSQVFSQYGCSGTQEVLMKPTTSTQTYTIDIIDATSGETVGQILTTAGVSQSSTREALTECRRN